MPTIYPSLTSLTMLVPVPVVPVEGDDFTTPSWEQGATDTAGLFSAFLDLAAPRAARFLLTGRDIALAGSLEEESQLQLLELSPEEDSSLPGITARPAMSHFEWAGVVR
ncbi:MAG TPA: hypothetical protein VGH65_02970, partial [Verrucomicrobiaceae bacterium]